MEGEDYRGREVSTGIHAETTITSQAKHASGSASRTMVEMVRNDRILDLFRKYSPGATSSEEVKALLI